MVSMQARSRLQKNKRKNTIILVFVAILGLLIGYTLALNIAVKETKEVRSLPNSATIIEQVHASEDVKEEVLMAKVTAYSCIGLKTEAQIRMNCPSLLSGKPRTADGTVPVAYKTVACDRANLGKYFDLEDIGVVKCTDTGNAIKGAGRFDLYVTDVAEARKWGVRELSYKLVIKE